MTDQYDFGMDPFDAPNGVNGHTNGHANGTAAGPVRWAFQTVPTLAWWLGRELPARDCLLGEVIATTSRIMMIAKTGIGKTNFAMAIALNLAAGYDFLHWRVGRPCRVLYVDGEMPIGLMQRRARDALRRSGAPAVDNFVLMSREDFPDMPPLNTPEGQAYLDDFMAWAGIADEHGERGFDFVIFDNIQALLTGEMKEPEQWSKMLNYTRDLTKRHVGQLWIHHANDDGRAYGDKTREWQLEAVMLLEPVERPDCDIAFTLSFPKKREATPENRNDFDEATITLSNDEWSSDRDLSTRRPRRKREAADIALDALEEAIASHGVTQPDPAVPMNRQAVTFDLWRRFFRKNYAAGFGDDAACDKEFYRQTKKLQTEQRIRYEKPWIWQV
jgi:hypothetical protein